MTGIEGGEPMGPTEGTNAVILLITVKVSENGLRPAELAHTDPVSAGVNGTAQSGQARDWRRD
jgi:hypothetical protein